jgi:hypothetical protein
MGQHRRSSCTSKRREAFLSAIAEGMSADKAAALVGVARRTVYDWRLADEAFRAAWDEAVDLSTDLLEQKLFEMAREGDVTALIFMLRSRKAAIYNPNLVVRQQMLQLALEKARAEAGVALTIEGNVASRAMIYPVQARLEMPRLLGKDVAEASEGADLPERATDPADTDNPDQEDAAA